MEGFYPSKNHGYLNATIPTKEELSEEKVVSLLSVLGSSISLVGLVFSFITYSLFSDWRNLSGTVLMNLLASLFMTQLLFVIGIGGIQDKELCFGLMFGTYFIRMTVWTWLLIMVRNSHTNFSLSLSLLSPIDPKIKENFWKSSLVGWFLPGILLVSALFLEYAETKGFDNVEELKTVNCSLPTGYAFFVSYLVPTLFVFFSSVWYLCKTYVVIKKNVCIQRSKRAMDKIHNSRMLQLSLFIKITAIISLVSLASILYAVTGKKVFLFAFNILQGLQGIMVAFCVTCNCQVLKIYTKPLRRVKKIAMGYEAAMNSDLSISTSLQILNLDPTPEVV